MDVFAKINLQRAKRLRRLGLYHLFRLFLVSSSRTSSRPPKENRSLGGEIAFALGDRVSWDARRETSLHMESSPDRGRTGSEEEEEEEEEGAEKDAPRDAIARSVKYREQDISGLMSSGLLMRTRANYQIMIILSVIDKK